MISAAVRIATLVLVASFPLRWAVLHRTLVLTLSHSERLYLYLYLYLLPYPPWPQYLVITF